MLKNDLQETISICQKHIFDNMVTVLKSQKTASANIKFKIDMSGQVAGAAFKKLAQQWQKG